MISLSKEWVILSRLMYGQEFIDELTEFLKENNVEEILECGCGGGYILNGLAKKGFRGIGIDSDSEMIEMALKNKHPNIEYKLMNWLDIDELKQFDLVMCRGNGLTYVDIWKQKDFDSNKVKKNIEKSIELFFKKTNSMVYIDTIPQSEIDNTGGEVEVNIGEINLKGKIEYNWEKKIRYVHGGGKLGNEEFHGGSVSYLIKPDELEQIIKKFNPSKIWRPKLKYEKNYYVICAKK